MSARIKNNNLYQLLEIAVKENGDKEAVVCSEDDVRVTFSELKIKVDAFANGLASVGVQKGEHLVIWGPNCLEWLLAQYAACKIGAIYTGLNPSYPPAEAIGILKHLEANTLVCLSLGDKNPWGLMKAVCPDLLGYQPGDIQCQAIPSLKRIIVDTPEPKPASYTIKQLSNMPEEQLTVGHNPDEVATIQLTSGTTGQPKGVMLTHRQVINNAFASGQHFDFEEQPDQKMCMPGPLFRCGIMSGSSVAMVLFHTTLVLSSRTPNPQMMLQSFTKERCTILSGNPPMLAAILKSPKLASFDMSSLRIILIGGSRASAWLLKQIKEKLKPEKIVQSVLMTEAGGNCIMGQPDIPEHHDGKPILNLEANIVDGTGATMAHGKIGELCMRGPAVSQGYWNMPDKTASTFKDQWLHTGDMALMTSDGCICMMDRKNDVITNKETVIYPSVIETAIRQCPQIADVQVVGVPGTSGDTVCACVKMQKEGEPVTLEDVKTLCQKHGMTEPDHIMVVEEFPQTPTRKVQKYKLREMFINNQNTSDRAT